MAWASPAVESSRDTSMDDATLRAQSAIYAAFMRSETQNEAHDLIVGKLLQGEFRWTMRGKDDRHVEEIMDVTSKEHKIWSTFVRRIVLQITVFGFAVYRLVRVGIDRDPEYMREKTSKYQDKAVRLEVYNSQNLMLQWNRKKARWDVYESMSSSSFLSRGGWHLTVFSEPRLVGPDNIAVPASAAAMSYRNSVYLERLHRNAQRRDTLNTDPVVYTTTSKMIMGASGRPLLDGPRDNQSNIMGDTHHDYSTWLAERLDSFRKFDELSAKARVSARNAMISMSRRDMTAGGGMDVDESVRPVEEPRELFVTDGRDASEMSFRKAPEQFEVIEKSLRRGIMKAWQIPLQATGETMNSERLASSDRLSQMAIDQFDAHIKLVRSTVQTALDKMSSAVLRHPDVFVRLWPCISAFNLAQMEPMLTTEAAVRLNACVYDIPQHYLDRSKVVYRQKMMLEQVQPDGTVTGSSGGGGHASNKHDAGGSGSGVRNKPAMSSKAKTVRKNRKAAS